MRNKGAVGEEVRRLHHCVTISLPRGFQLMGRAMSTRGGGCWHREEGAQSTNLKGDGHGKGSEGTRRWLGGEIQERFVTEVGSTLNVGEKRCLFLISELTALSNAIGGENH